MNYLEVLARLGAGSAHPGGFTATLDQLKQFPIPRGSHILEVGCGTGRTACMLSMLGYRVTALDLREDMLEKARIRASAMKVSVEFVQGDAAELPFPSYRFDTILGESVSVFANTEQAIREYHRVLKQGGVLYDREIMIVEDANEEVSRAFADFYGIRRLFSAREWMDFFRQAGLRSVEIWNPSPFPTGMLQDQLDYPDHYQIADAQAYDDDQLVKTVELYDAVMARYAEAIRSGVVIGVKRGEAGA